MALEDGVAEDGGDVGEDGEHDDLEGAVVPAGQPVGHLLAEAGGEGFALHGVDVGDDDRAGEQAGERAVLHGDAVVLTEGGAEGGAGAGGLSGSQTGSFSASRGRGSRAAVAVRLLSYSASCKRLSVDGNVRRLSVIAIVARR